MAQILFPVFIVVEDSKNMTTFGETRELRRKIAQESWFWESSFKVIAKHMLVMQFGISGCMGKAGRRNRVYLRTENTGKWILYL